MKTPPPQSLRADMSPATRGDDRRQQTDRRRVSGRRETDQQPEESFRLDGIQNEQANKQSAITSHHRGATVKSWPATQILTEDEIKFILNDNAR